MDERCEQAMSSAAVQGSTQKTVKLEGLAQFLASSDALRANATSHAVN